VGAEEKIGGEGQLLLERVGKGPREGGNQFIVENSSERAHQDFKGEVGKKIGKRTLIPATCQAY